MRKLWYEKPANIWEQALPVGNGRIGAMVFSGEISDRLQINEDTLWSGYPGKESRKHSVEELDEIRRLIAQGKYAEANNKTQATMLKVSSEAYVTYGSLFIDILADNDNVSEYRRELDLTEGVANASYKLGGVSVNKEYFVSLKDDLLVVNIKCSSPLSFHIYEAVELKNEIDNENGIITSVGLCPADVSTIERTVSYDLSKETIHFCSGVKVRTDSSVHGCGNSLWVDNATEITVLFSIKTSFNGYNKMPVSEGKEYIKSSLGVIGDAERYTYAQLRDRHTDEYKRFFNRVSLKIDGEDFDDIPTDKRIERMSEGETDNELVCILFDFGRYLMISSSMEGTQPANLQGIWNQRMIAPWRSNYTMNINTQMNYWFTETVNLPECHMPLLKMLKDFSEKGNNFGLRGWSSWHCSDIWRFNHEATSLPRWGYWQMGGFWTCRHIWEHYIHTGDKEFLEEYYPVLIGAADFLEDWMYERDGVLTTCPSTSPENGFVSENEHCSVCEGSAMDMSVIYDLFDKVIKAGDVLGKETERYKTILKKLKPVKIGEDGRILEWGAEAVEKEPGHRHISHLYGFFPSDIWSDGRYDESTEKTLEYRLKNGGGHTGWSNAWIANVYARLKNGDKVMDNIRNMFKKSMYPNMFDAHPPFQIDGNFGICSAICEALIQSHKDNTELIPALPKEWKSGEVRGFITRKGEQISFKW